MTQTTPPPISNKFVAEGCKQFASPTDYDCGWNEGVQASIEKCNELARQSELPRHKSIALKIADILSDLLVIR